MTLAPELAAITDVGVTAPITAPGIGPGIGVTAAELDDAGLGWAGHLPEWRLLVAPLGGTFRAVPQPGLAGGAPAVVGYVEARSDRREIIPPWRGPIIEWLVQDGDPISAGQALARLLPDGAG
jgi:multidrug efflux pump subunit AcrA (membrane-fusion protein)